MKSICLSLVIACVFAAAGCGKSGENSLATDGASAEDIARYEEELAAVSGDDSYEDAEDADDMTE